MTTRRCQGIGFRLATGGLDIVCYSCNRRGNGMQAFLTTTVEHLKTGRLHNHMEK